MNVHRLERRQFVPRPVADVFAFFAEARNLERITPDWLSFQVRSPEPVEMAVGARIEYHLKVHGIPLRWVSRIDAWEPERAFVDRQLTGPYRLWHHRHDFSAVAGGTLVGDTVDYALPLWPLGELAWPLFVRRDLRRIFDHRNRAVLRLLR